MPRLMFRAPPRITDAFSALSAMVLTLIVPPSVEGGSNPWINVANCHWAKA